VPADRIGRARRHCGLSKAVGLCAALSVTLAGATAQSALAASVSVKTPYSRSPGW